MLPMALALLQAAALLLSNHAVFTGAAFTSDQKTEILNMHNRLREGAYPTPTKMNFLTWNNDFEAIAQRGTERCELKHNSPDILKYLSENIYGDPADTINATKAVLGWLTEKTAYNYAENNCSPQGKIHTCGHYQNVVADDVLEVGCGHHKCPPDKDIWSWNYVFCVYSNGNPGDTRPPYTSSSPEFACSKCPPNRRLCLSGLCVNSSIVGMADVQGFDNTATLAGTACKLSCSNCGVRTSDCTCKCDPAISSGDFCEKKVDGSKLTCSLCTQLNTPCLNGGVEQSDATSCICKCTDDYVGKQCQLFKTHYQNAMELTIGKDDYCAFQVCIRVPITRTVFRLSIWTQLRTAIAKAVNSFCNANQANFALCCPKSAAKPSSEKPLVADADVAYMENADMITDDGGFLHVAVHVKITPANNLLCPTSRRRRATTSEPMLPQTVLTSAIQHGNASISGVLGFTIASLQKPGTVGRDSATNLKNLGTRASPLGAGGLLLSCLCWLVVENIAM